MEQQQERGLKLLAVSIFAVLLLHSVFLISLSRWLWGRDHYQFFPLVLIGSATLAWFRLKGKDWSPVCQISVRVACYTVLAMSLFILAHFASSHWLGSLAAILACWTAIWFVGGTELTGELRGPVALLLLAIPLPLNLDLRLILELQKLATASAGQLLDLAGIGHTISGVAIQTSSRDYMVEEACSGIHSLFSSVAAMSLLAALGHYGVVRIGLTLLQTSFWVCVANCLRVFTIVFARERWDVDLEAGFPHELLGVCTYALGLLLSLSADQILRFMVPIDADSQSVFKKKTAGSMDDSFAYRLKKIRKSVASFFNDGRTSETSTRATLASVLVIYLGLTGYLAIGALRAAPESTTTVNFEQPITNLIREDALPQRIGQWEQTGVRVVNRTPDDPLGANSIIWTFAGEGMEIELSLDGFYSEWHDLSYCYAALGWKIESAFNENPDAGAPVCQLGLYRDSGDYAVSLFSCYDSQQAAIEPKDPNGTGIRKILDRLRAGKLIAEQSQPVAPPVFQIQLMTSQQTSFMPHELRSVKLLFVDLRSRILTAVKESGND